MEEEIKKLKHQIIKILSVQMTILDLLESKEKRILINKMLEDNKDG
jgi:hypothetical protein